MLIDEAYIMFGDGVQQLNDSERKNFAEKRRPVGAERHFINTRQDACTRAVYNLQCRQFPAVNQ